ncbi:RNA polymerase sigma factor [uncultured Ruminococcus sp.]|uniref:RNA polymerase sigma factor n=1 Tax=uncultured Ruminococcus sp. TaxID=165186 RepID=UPI00341D3236
MDNGASSYNRFLSGDKSGLEEIIRLYSDSLTLYICTLVGNIDDAREIMTETFIKLYMKKPKFSGKSLFKTWLYSIARHTSYDYLKNKQKYQTLSEE